MGFSKEIADQFGRLSPTRKDLRHLGLIFLTALGIIGVILWWRERPSAPWFLAGAALFGLWGLVWPRGLGPLYRAWMGLALVAGSRFPCFHRFRGGKGVAGYLGFLLPLAPWTAARNSIYPAGPAPIDRSQTARRARCVSAGRGARGWRPPWPREEAASDVAPAAGSGRWRTRRSAGAGRLAPAKRDGRRPTHR